MPINHKAISIVYSKDKPRRFLTVCDRRFGDWTFVTGGCRKRELFFPLKTALRELEEETRGVVKIQFGSYKYFYFVDSQFPDSVYHVYLMELDIPTHIQNYMLLQFVKQRDITELRKRNRMSIKRSFDENTHMSWDTWQEFMRKTRWPLITRSILNNHRFYDLLDNDNLKIPFDLRKGGGGYAVVARPLEVARRPPTESHVDGGWEVQRSSRGERRFFSVDGQGT